MQTRIGGNAMPSLRPLSTLIDCRMLTGTSGLFTTACPRAASVGDSINAISRIAQISIPSNITQPSNVPRIIVKGSPISSRRTGI